MTIVLILVALLVVVGVIFFLKKAPASPTEAPGRSADKPISPRGSSAASGAATSAPRSEAASTRGAHEAEKAPASTTPVATPSASDAQTTSAGTPPEVAEVDVEPSESDDDAPRVTSPPPPPVRGPKSGRLSTPPDLQSMRRGLAKSREAGGFFGRLRNLFVGKKEIASDIAAEIEEVLLTSDVGVKTTEAIMQSIQERLSRGELESEERVWNALREEAHRILAVEGKSGGIQIQAQPTVVLFVGVNGAGKTTTIGKLARKLKSEGKKVMLAAGDTFRAAAVDQLKAWGERTGCEVISGKDNADPGSVLFDAIQAARAQGVDVLLADTAGRLHTKTNLMQEMTKIARTAGKALDGAPHEVFLVLDSTNGQNALAQAKEFSEALPLTGLVLTKLDGTARGGVVLGVCGALQVPVRYVGLGEKAEDLHEFSASAFVEALLGQDSDEIAA